MRPRAEPRSRPERSRRAPRRCVSFQNQPTYPTNLHSAHGNVDGALLPFSLMAREYFVFTVLKSVLPYPNIIILSNTYIRSTTHRSSGISSVLQRNIRGSSMPYQRCSQLYGRRVVIDSCHFSLDPACSTVRSTFDTFERSCLRLSWSCNPERSERNSRR